MWEYSQQLLNSGATARYSVLWNGLPISYGNVLKHWQADDEFRSFFISILAANTFRAYRWETPPITALTANRDFEFVLLDAPGLDQTPDISAFSEQFRQAGPNESVVTFSNLGGDALLVVPCPTGAADKYGHLASFIREAAVSQVHKLWQSVGAAMSQKLGQSPIWLSTAGMGVSWLHVRLDSRPKYYGFSAYRVAT